MFTPHGRESRPGARAGVQPVRAGWSGDEVEGGGVGGFDGCEVAVVEGGDGGVAVAFSDRDSGRVDDVESEIGVGGDEVEHSGPVAGGELDWFEPAGGDHRGECCLGGGAGAVEEQPGGLGDHEGGRGEFVGVIGEDRGAGVVVAGTAVAGSEPDVGIDEQHVGGGRGFRRGGGLRCRHAGCRCRCRPSRGHRNRTTR